MFNIRFGPISKAFANDRHCAAKIVRPRSSSSLLLIVPAHNAQLRPPACRALEWRASAHHIGLQQNVPNLAADEVADLPWLQYATGSREENASKQKIRASVLIQSDPKRL